MTKLEKLTSSRDELQTQLTQAEADLAATARAVKEAASVYHADPSSKHGKVLDEVATKQQRLAAVVNALGEQLDAAKIEVDEEAKSIARAERDAMLRRLAAIREEANPQTLVRRWANYFGVDVTRQIIDAERKMHEEVEAMNELTSEAAALHAKLKLPGLAPTTIHPHRVSALVKQQVEITTFGTTNQELCARKRAAYYLPACDERIGFGNIPQ